MSLVALLLLLLSAAPLRLRAAPMASHRVARKWAASATEHRPGDRSRTLRVAVCEHVPVTGHLGVSRADALRVMHANLDVFEDMARRASLQVRVLYSYMF